MYELSTDADDLVLYVTNIGGIHLTTHLFENGNRLQASNTAAANPSLGLWVLACGCDLTGHNSTVRSRSLDACPVSG